MKCFKELLLRNTKLFFKDKPMFFSALITPIILLVLFATFLGNVYRDSFSSAIPDELSVPKKLINAIAAGQMFSSLLAVSCITVAFCCNLLMVQDKFTGARRDLTVSPVKKSVLALSYYCSTLISTLTVCYTATLICTVYIISIGMYMTVTDFLLLLLDVFILSMFGTALSSIVSFFLSTQGQMSAVGTIVSSGYGFICGAYMPLSSFSDTLRNILMLLPGTYATGLIRNHALSGALNELQSYGLPAELIDGIRDSLDCNLYFFGSKASSGAMYTIILSAVAALIAVYIIINKLSKAKK